MERLVAIGADGARGGWLAACCYQDPDRNPDAPARPHRTALSLEPTFAALADLRAGTEAVMTVDVPMGLLDAVAPRPCDRAARKLLGRRASTIFTPPSRPLLAAQTYGEARAIIAERKARDPSVAGLSAQAFGITPKVREVDDWLRTHPGAQAWLYECHPELAFSAMASAVLPGKRSAQGQLQRSDQISAQFPDAPRRIAESRFQARQAQLADILDAYAALASALRIRAGEHTELGGERDGAGLVMRIVY